MIPGAGQMYKGQIGGGLAWLMFTVLGYLMLLIPGVLLHVLCIFDAASGDPAPAAPATSKDLIAEGMRRAADRS